jgi:hypothetical protein
MQPDDSLTVRMLRTTLAADADGVTVRVYSRGGDYRVDATRGALFIRERWAEPAREDWPAVVTARLATREEIRAAAAEDAKQSQVGAYNAGK